MKLRWYYAPKFNRELVQIAVDRFVEKHGVQPDTITFRPEEAPKRVVVLNGLTVERGLARGWICGIMGVYEQVPSQGQIVDRRT